MARIILRHQIETMNKVKGKMTANIRFSHLLIGLISTIIFSLPALAGADPCTKELQKYKSFNSKLKQQKAEIVVAKKKYDKFIKKQKRRNRKIRNSRSGRPQSFSINGKQERRYRELIGQYNSNIDKQKKLYKGSI